MTGATKPTLLPSAMVNNSEHLIMKQPKSWLKHTLAVAGSLLAVGLAQAQYTSTTLSDFSNFNLSVTYANWNVDGSDPLNGGTGFTPIITSGPTSYRVQAQGYGSGAYDFLVPVSAPGATHFSLTFTINAPGTANWMNPGVRISDGTHQVALTAANAEGGFLNYGNYSAPNTYTLIGPLNDQFGGAPLDPTTITAFNLEFDPAGFGAGAPYDITYHNLSLLTPVPEPSSLALAGLGAIGLAAARRRNR
jgi:hypothetical protein